MKKLLNCPNCGAPITAVECPYCGTLFYDFASIDLDKPSYLRVNVGGTTCLFRARLDSCTLQMSTQEVPELTMDFAVLPDDRGVLLARKAKECGE